MKKTFCTFCLGGCLVLSLPAAALEQNALGRLFFTPQERTQMEFERDSGRQRNRQQSHKEPPPIPQQVQINGLVWRSSGRNTVWINGSQSPPPGLQPDLSTLQGAQIPIQLHSGPQSLKPGQHLATENGNVVEGFNARQAPR